MKRLALYSLAPLAASVWAWAIVLALETRSDGLLALLIGPLAIVLVAGAAMALVGLAQLAARLMR